jgi:hypothetical protein
MQKISAGKACRRAAEKLEDLAPADVKHGVASGRSVVHRLSESALPV